VIHENYEINQAAQCPGLKGFLSHLLTKEKHLNYIKELAVFGKFRMFGK